MTIGNPADGSFTKKEPSAQASRQTPHRIIKDNDELGSAYDGGDQQAIKYETIENLDLFSISG